MNWKDITFPEAIAQSEDLLSRLERKEASEDEVRQKLGDLLSSNSGARGFFVAYLTGEYALSDQPPDTLVSALKEHPEIVCDLLARNLVMSTTMYLSHERKGDQEAAEGSARVSRRTRLLISLLELPEMKDKLDEMRKSIAESQGIYTDFLKRWTYDDEQLRLAEEAVCKLLS